MSLTPDLCGHLQFFEKLIENKHMSDTNHDTNMTGNADNRSELRTNCGQEINQDVQGKFLRCPQCSQFDMMTRNGWNGVLTCERCRMSWSSNFVDGWNRCFRMLAETDQPTTAPSDAIDQDAIDQRIYALDQYELACRQLNIGVYSDDPGDTLLEAVCHLKRELAEAREDAANQRRLADMALAHRDVIIAERDTLAEALTRYDGFVRHELGHYGLRPDFVTQALALKGGDE
jgi:hypothetical protein